MRTVHSMRHGILAPLAAFSLMSGCGSDGTVGDPEPDEPEDGNAYLSIVGDANVMADLDTQLALSVRYHDGDGQPLAGEVEFEIFAGGEIATLAAGMSPTNGDGVATTDVQTGTQPGQLRVRATAPYADAAEWNITVVAGGEEGTRILSGSYRVESVFDVISAMPGTAGDAVNIFIDMTDDPHDPATWLLDVLDNQILNQVRFIVDPLLNSVIKDNAPELINNLLQLGNHLGDVTRELGIRSVLQIQGSPDPDGTYVANHTPTHFFFSIDSTDHVYSFAELEDTTIGADAVAVTYDDDAAALSMAQHSYQIPYGGLLALALEEVIVPAVDPTADDLHDLIDKAIDCDAFGSSAADAIGYGSASTYETLCEGAVLAGSEFALQQLRQIDQLAPVTLQLAGEARGSDRSGDGVIDKIAQGQWSGSIDYNGTQELLPADTGDFTGERM